jgi:hypothetical protein
MGEVIGLAGYVERVPMFNLSEENDSVGFERRKRYLKHVRLMFREIMVFGQGIAQRADERRDGRGNVERIELTTGTEPTQTGEAQRADTPSSTSPRRSRAMSYADILNYGKSEAEQAPSPQRPQRRVLSPEELVNYDPDKQTKPTPQ